MNQPKKYSNFDSKTYHISPQMEKEKAATCTEAGRTQYTYCKDCKEILSGGTEIPATGHNYTSTVTKEPTTSEEGVRTYTCSDCRDTYNEAIAKLPDTTPEQTPGSTPEQTPTPEIKPESKPDSTPEDKPETKPEETPDTDSEKKPAPTPKPETKPEASPTQKPETTPDNTQESTLESTPTPETTPGTQSRQNSGSTTNNTPDSEKTEKPFIKEDVNKVGWDNIRNEIKDAISEASDSNENVTINIDMNGTTIVPGDVIETIAGKDVTIVLDMGKYFSWSVNGQTVTQKAFEDIDFGVTTGGNAILVEVINNITGEKSSMNLSLAYDGAFGFSAVLTIDMDKKNAGYFANLFYYNEQTGTLEFVCADEIDADGNTELTFTHASEYTIVIDTEPMNANLVENAENNDSAESTESEDAWNPIGIIIIGVLVVAVGIFFIIIRRKKEEEL